MLKRTVFEEVLKEEGIGNLRFLSLARILFASL